VAVATEKWASKTEAGSQRKRDTGTTVCLLYFMETFPYSLSCLELLSLLCVTD